jgi:hypothetical protein
MVGVPVEYTIAYPAWVAPVPGKVAAVQLSVNCPDADAVAVKELALAVGGDDNVRNVPSELMDVPMLLVA